MTYNYAFKRELKETVKAWYAKEEVGMELRSGKRIDSNAEVEKRNKVRSPKLSSTLHG